MLSYGIVLVCPFIISCLLLEEEVLDMLLFWLSAPLVNCVRDWTRHCPDILPGALDRLLTGFGAGLAIHSFPDLQAVWLARSPGSGVRFDMVAATGNCE